MIKGIKETCLYISDIKATSAFYLSIGLTILSEEKDSHIFFRAGRDVLLCFLKGTTQNQSHLPPHFAEGQIHYAFETAPADYEALKNKITSAGISIEYEKTWRENVKSFYFRDPDMHCVEVVTHELWG